MEEWVILQLPFVLLLYGAALFFCLFDRRYKATRGVFTILSAVLAILAAAFDLIGGAALWEAAAVLLVPLLLTMGVRE